MRLRPAAVRSAGILFVVVAVVVHPVRGDEAAPPAVATDAAAEKPAENAGGAPANGAEPGQADLDAALEAKMAAQTLEDYGRVLDLCRTALEKGLDEKGREFADKLYTGTLVDRAGMLVDVIYATVARDPQWPRMRAFAMRDLQEIVARDPKLGQAHLMIARLEALPQGNRDRAAETARRALELLGDDPLQQARAHVVLAHVAEDDDDRRKHFDAAVELAPRDVEVRRARGLFRLVEDEFEAAREDLEVAAAEDPDNASLHEALGMACAKAEKLPEARRAFDRAIELAPEAPGPLLQRAVLAAVEEKTDEAIADLDRAVELAPEDPAARLLRARVRAQADDDRGAREDIEAVLRTQPENPGALELRGVLAAARLDFAGAIRDFRRLVARRPDDAALIGQLGTLYMMANQPRKAIERYTRALELDDENFSFRRGRSDALISIGDHEAALADLEVALELKPDDSGVLNNLAWLLATSTIDELRDGARAIELATKACEVTEWREAHIVSTLAAAYAEQGDFETAKKYSRQAIELGGVTDDMQQQLQGELTTYEEGKPVRERQQTEDAELDAGPDVDLEDSEPVPAAASDAAAEDTVTVPDEPRRPDAEN